MPRIVWISGCLFVLVVANALAQSSSTATETEACTGEDYAISTVALNDLFATQKPDRVLLRDHTFVHLRATDPINKFYFRDVPEEATVNFDSRNMSNAKIEEEKIKNVAAIMLLSAEGEDKLVKSGGGCEDKSPITFVSRPGVNIEHNRALISVGTSCYDHQHTTFMLLGKDSGDWKVLSRLLESSMTIDRFPPQPAATFTPIEPKIVSVQQIDEGNHSLMKVSFIVPDVRNYTFDTITVYGMRFVGTQRSDDRNYPTLHGRWKPKDPVEFSVRVPREFTDPLQGWNLTFCVGSTQSCYPSSNLLKLIRQKDK